MNPGLTRLFAVTGAGEPRPQGSHTTPGAAFVRAASGQLPAPRSTKLRGHPGGPRIIPCSNPSLAVSNGPAGRPRSARSTRRNGRVGGRSHWLPPALAAAEHGPATDQELAGQRHDRLLLADPAGLQPQPDAPRPGVVAQA